MMALASIAGDGFAQDDQKSGKEARPAQQRGVQPALRTRQVIEEYAACIVSRSPKNAILMVTKPSSEWGMRAIVPSCLEVRSGETNLRIQDGLLRGYLFQSLYSRDYRKTLPQWRASDPDYAADQLSSSTDKDQYLAERRFAQCVLRADPEDVHNLLNATSGSSAESTAFANVKAVMTPCLPAGRTFSFGKAVLLGWLAEAAYRTAEGSPVS